jgi:hypothetical protein
MTKKKYSRKATKRPNRKRYSRRRQIGGDDWFPYDPSGWVKVPNSGQQNCGIFLNESYPSSIIKCESSYVKPSIDFAFDLQATILLFPKYIEIKVSPDGRNLFTFMDKLEGDLTKLIQIKLDQSLIDFLESKSLEEDVKKQYINLFDLKTRFSNKFTDYNTITLRSNLLAALPDDSTNINAEIRSSDSFGASKTLYQILGTFTEIKKETFDELMLYINTNLDALLAPLHKEICRIEYELFKNRSRVYRDLKYDNFGFKSSPIPLEHDFRKENVFKYKDFFIYTYFLDPASGISLVGTDNEMDLLSIVNENKYDYSVYGGYTLGRIFIENPLLRGANSSPLNTVVNMNKIKNKIQNDELYEVLMTDYILHSSQPEIKSMAELVTYASP